MEHREQVALFELINLHIGRWTELEWAFAIPNGGKRDKRTAVLLKAEGVKAGVSDIFIPAARYHRGRWYHGLFLELKAGRNKPTEAQIAFIEGVTTQGYYATWATGAEAAWAVIRSYLGLPRFPPENGNG